MNKAESTASLIDLKTGAIRATLPTGQGPHEAATSPDGKYALITNYGTAEAAGSSLTLVDISAARTLKTIELASYQKAHGVRWLKDGKTAVVTAEASQALLVIDVFEGSVRHTIPTGQAVSHMVTVTPDERRAFVANIGSGNVTVIDLTKGETIRNIVTGAGAEGIDITPDGKEVWVTNRQTDTVSVIDTERLEVVETLESKSFPIRAKATPDGKHVLVSNARSGEIAVFSTEARKEVRRVKIPLEAGGTEGRLFGAQFGASSVPIGIVIHPDGTRAYIANSNADAVAVLDLQEWKVIGTLKAGKEPDGMAYSPVD
ncbi:MAG TPA: cytochrome D1 domain-containing protein [Acidobacteriota bacterium]